MHLAEKILLPQPLTFGGDYPPNVSQSQNWTPIRGQFCAPIDNDLPRFVKLLRKFSEASHGVVGVDDLARIFRNYRLDRRNLLAELEPYGDHIISLRHAAKLSLMSDATNEILVMYAEFD